MLHPDVHEVVEEPEASAEEPVEQVFDDLEFKDVSLSIILRAAIRQRQFWFV
jgi:hypothetical protein